MQISLGRIVEDVRVLVQNRQHQVTRLGALLVRAVVDQLCVDEPRVDILGVQLEQLLESELRADEVLVLDVLVAKPSDLTEQ